MVINLGDFYLRAVEKKDLEWLRALRSDESTWSQLGTIAFIYEATQEKWFEDLSQRKDAEYLVLGRDKQNLGIVRLTEIDKTNRSMCVGGDILSHFRNKGYSKEMYKLIFKLGFDVMGMHRLWLLVLATNEKALHVYKSVGFKQEGLQREAIFRNGKFTDYLMMSILDREYTKYQQMLDSS